MILACHHITKAFSENVILKDASFGVEAYEKAAIVGINGAGKSTLLKIIVGELSPDQGEVIVSAGKTLGYLAQQEMLSGHQTIWEELLETKRSLLETQEQMHALEHEMKHLHGKALQEVMDRYHALTTRFEQENGYAMNSEITGVLKGLGFDEEDFHKQTDTLSGGQKTRVGLAKLLLSAPDIILLDEPTNHLDMRSVAWLENFLKSYRGTVIVVAHDRYFLDKFVDKVVEIDQGKVTSFAGNYTAYAAKKKQLMDAARKAWVKQQQQIRHQEDVIAKLRSYNREKSIKRAESRVKMLDKMERVEKPMEADAQIKLTLDPACESGVDVLQVNSLSKAFDDQILFQDISFLIRRGERVAVIGDNGTGKTTLLKIINGLIPADSGSITLGSRVEVGYYDQEHQVLHPDKTLFEEISDAYPDLNNTKIRNVLAAFLFTGDDVFGYVRDLSGGERGRLSLARLMLSGANFLILDEPTNHLDLYSKEILESALSSYTGTVLYVSHDRYFINQTATRILDLENEQLVSYLGDYDYYLEKHEEAAAGRLSHLAGGSRTGASTMTGQADKGYSAGDDAGLSRAASAGSKDDWLRQKEEEAARRKRENELARTETAITELEEEDARIDAQLTREEVFTDLEQVTALSTRKARIAQELEELYAKWEELA